MSTPTYRGACDSCNRPMFGPPLGESGGAGYATDREIGVRYCYQCAAEYDRAHMRKHGKVTLYLTNPSRGTLSPSDMYTGWVISNWPGSLTFPTRGLKRSFSYGFGRRYNRYDAWFAFDGSIWHAVNAGDNQIARCRRTKESA